MVALRVTDERGYRSYRAEMTPLLEDAGGRFVHDFRVTEVLRSEVGFSINRLFLMEFPDEAASDSFFACRDYKEIRRRHFDPSVGESAVLTTFTV